MYEIKVFTSSTPREVEYQANRWLRRMRDIHLVDVTSTDVIQLAPEGGMQRFTLVLTYERE